MQEEKKDSPYAIAKLEFTKRGHRDKSLCAYTDMYKVYFSNLTSFREFFGIEYKENQRDLIEEFTKKISAFIPNRLTDKEEVLKKSITEHLNKEDSETSTSTRCIHVEINRIKKNGTPGRRSPENNQKVTLLRPELFRKLMEAPTISFCFSEDPTKKHTDEDILLR